MAGGRRVTHGGSGHGGRRSDARGPEHSGFRPQRPHRQSGRRKWRAAAGTESGPSSRVTRDRARSVVPRIASTRPVRLRIRSETTPPIRADVAIDRSTAAAAGSSRGWRKSKLTAMSRIGRQWGQVTWAMPPMKFELCLPSEIRPYWPSCRSGSLAARLVASSSGLTSCQAVPWGYVLADAAVTTVGGHATGEDLTGNSCGKLPSHDTSRYQRLESWPGSATSFRWTARGMAATSGSSHSSPIRARSERS